MKTYVCHRCGKKYEGRRDRCPRCGQLFVYARGGRFYDALGNEVILKPDGEHILKYVNNPVGPATNKD